MATLAEIEKLTAEYAAEEMQFKTNGRRRAARTVESFKLVLADVFGRLD